MASDSKSQYFKSYGDLSVHELMLKDEPRTLAYKSFIEENCDEFRNKVVLDVGAGTGILSLFAAKMGARKVFAVEASGMASACRQIVKLNGFADKVKVIEGLVEEIELPVEKVDVIISEWMGFYLLHESMLDSVLFARDKWLSSDGFMVPSHASMFVGPVHMGGYCADHFEYWHDVYGFDFSPLVTSAVHTALTQPVITALNSNQCLSKAQTLATFSLKSVQLEEIQNIRKTLVFEIESVSTLHGFGVWFDVDFKLNRSCDQSESTNQEEAQMAVYKLSTSPMAPETHWKQTVCFLPSYMTVEKGEKVYCKIALSQAGDDKRQYNICIELLEDGKEVEEDAEEEDEDEYDSGDLEEEEEDTSSHPVPCSCSSARCKLISAIMEKYDEEQTQLELEAEFVDVAAEVEAAKVLDSEGGLNDSSVLEASEETS